MHGVIVLRLVVEIPARRGVGHLVRVLCPETQLRHLAALDCPESEADEAGGHRAEEEAAGRHHGQPWMWLGRERGLRRGGIGGP